MDDLTKLSDAELCDILEDFAKDVEEVAKRHGRKIREVRQVREAARRLRELTHAAIDVLQAIDRIGAPSYLMDTDDNPAQRLRNLIPEWREPEGE